MRPFKNLKMARATDDALFDKAEHQIRNQQQPHAPHLYSYLISPVEKDSKLVREEKLFARSHGCLLDLYYQQVKCRRSSMKLQSTQVPELMWRTKYEHLLIEIL